MPRALTDRRAPDDAPISTLNTTPLIDVMLVLLIMLIVTIPSLTHRVPVDLAQGKNSAPPGSPHQLDITADGSLLWDGVRISDAQLPALLKTGASTDTPLLLKTMNQRATSASTQSWRRSNARASASSPLSGMSE